MLSSSGSLRAAARIRGEIIETLVPVCIARGPTARMARSDKRSLISVNVVTAVGYLIG